jgi:hypothetical protein
MSTKLGYISKRYEKRSLQKKQNRLKGNASVTKGRKRQSQLGKAAGYNAAATRPLQAVLNHAQELKLLNLRKRQYDIYINFCRHLYGTERIVFKQTKPGVKEEVKAYAEVNGCKAFYSGKTHTFFIEGKSKANAEATIQSIAIILGSDKKAFKFVAQEAA